jgi:hypothetical protein
MGGKKSKRASICRKGKKVYKSKRLLIQLWQYTTKQVKLLCYARHMKNNKRKQKDKKIQTRFKSTFVRWSPYRKSRMTVNDLTCIEIDILKQKKRNFSFLFKKKKTIEINIWTKEDQTKKHKQKSEVNTQTRIKWSKVKKSTTRIRLVHRENFLMIRKKN